MAGSSSSIGVDGVIGHSVGTLSLGSSVEELRVFIRLNCSDLVSVIDLEKLIAAAVATMVRKKAIDGFRTCCFLAKEGHGRLYDLVKQLAPPPPTMMSDFNPFANFKAEHPNLALPTELDFLLEGYEERVQCMLDFDLGLTDEEASRVTEALIKKRIPEWLMEPCTFLTFEENLDTRVQVVRLWISASKLPMYVGSTIDFEELSQMTVPPEKPAGFNLEENLPSKFQVRIREETLTGIYWSNTVGGAVKHPTLTDLPNNCLAFTKCYAKLRYPIRIDENGCPSYGLNTGDVEVDEEEFREGMECDLDDFRCTETPRMYKRLAALIYSKDVVI